jgi:hypothetical protein
MKKNLSVVLNRLGVVFCNEQRVETATPEKNTSVHAIIHVEALVIGGGRVVLITQLCFAISFETRMGRFVGCIANLTWFAPTQTRIRAHGRRDLYLCCHARPQLGS